MSEDVTKDYDIYNSDGSVNLAKLKKLKGVDVPRALAEINTFAPKGYSGRLMIYQRKVLVDKLKAVNPDFKVKGKSDYKIAEAIVEAVRLQPARCKANYISNDLYKVCKVIADMKLTVCHTIAMTQDESGNDVVISLDDFDNPVHVFNNESENKDESEGNEVFENILPKLDSRVSVGTEMYFQLSNKVVLAKVVEIQKRVVVLSIDGEDRKFRISAVNVNMEMQADLEDRWMDQTGAKAEAEVAATETEAVNNDEVVEKENNDIIDEKENNTMKNTNKTTNATVNKKNSAAYKKIIALLKALSEDDIEAVVEELGIDEELDVNAVLAYVASNFSVDEVTKAIESVDEEELDDDEDDLEDEESDSGDSDDEEDDDLDDDDSEEDDEEGNWNDWDEILEGVSVNNLKAMCKKLKVAMAEIKGRSKADLISIILEYDEEDIERVYNSIGATSKESEKSAKSAPEKQSKSNGKYWENETPIESITEGNIVNYYEEAKKLQLYRRIEKDGEFIKSKGVTIDVDTMSSKDALQMISMMCYALKDAIDDDRVKDLVNQMESINIEYNTEQYLFSKASEMDDYDVTTLRKMALNCGCPAKNVKSAGKAKLQKLIIDATQRLNG